MSSNFDVIICGLGVMGVSAARSLAGRGLRVLGLEQFDIPNDRGSSHGKSRVIRTAYFEDPRYVPLCRSAFAAWAELEREAGRQLIFRTGVLNMGPPEHECTRGVLESVRQHGLEHEVLTAADIRERWPALVPNDTDVGVFESAAGYLTPEACVTALAESARHRGATLRTQTRVDRWTIEGDGVVVEAGGERYVGKQLVITAGGWFADAVQSLGVSLNVERQVQLWWQPADVNAIAPGRTPVFIHFVDDRAYYSIPPFGDYGIKISRHHGGEITTADAVDRTCRDADEADVRNYIRRHIPAADGPRIDAQVCLYTNTPDDHFLVDRLPGADRVWVAGGFSGHGFKFGPVIGDALADFVCDGRTNAPIDHFRFNRFSA